MSTPAFPAASPPPPLDLPNPYDMFHATRNLRLVLDEYREARYEITPLGRRALETAILAEQDAAEARVIDDYNRVSCAGIERTDDCTHEALTVYHRVASPFDDHETHLGHCPACDRWIHRTIWLSRRAVDDRLATDAELRAYAAIDDQRRWSEQQ